MTIIESAEKFKEALAKRETRAVREILAAYGEILKNLEPQIKKLEKELENNPDVSMTDVFTLERLKNLEKQIEIEIEKFANQAAETVAANQRINAVRAVSDASEMLGASFVSLPKSAIETFVGMSADGSSLTAAFKNLAPHAVQSVRNKILEGIALGYNLRKTASRIRQAFGRNAARALTITRTATMTAYREATRETYKKNSRIVQGWIWYAGLGTRTCVVCWAMHGTVHSNDEAMGSHPNCRCTMLPYLAEKSLIETGEEQFEKLSKEEQVEILGKDAYEKYKEGNIELSDFVGVKKDKFDKLRYKKPLSEIKPKTKRI